MTTERATKFAAALQDMGWDLGTTSHKVCVQCQTQLHEDANWCHSCGNKVLTPSEDAVAELEKAFQQVFGA